MTRNYLLFTFLLFSFPLLLSGKHENADSLLKQITQHKVQDTVLVNLLNQYATEVSNTDHPKSFQKATEAYRLANDLHYESGIAWAAVRLSALHTFYKLEYDKATRYALEALKIGETIDDKKVQSKAYTFMAVCYANSSDSVSLVYMQKALSLAEESGDDETITAALLNLAISNILQKNYGIAIQYLERARGYALRTENQFTQMGVYANLGRAYRGINKTESALANYFKGIEYARNQKNYRYWSLQLSQVGEIYHSQGNIEKALQYVTQSLQIARENMLKEGAMEAYSVLNKIYRDLGNYKEAYMYQSLYYAIADSLNNRQALKNIEQMQQKFKLEKEKLQADQLLKEQEQKTFNQFVAIGLGIVALSIFVVLISGSIVVRPRMVKLLGVLGLLITFEFINLLLHPFLERITHHTPVLMLVCLAGIAGILIPLHHRLEKWITSKLVEKNKRIHISTARKILAAVEKSTDKVQN